MSLVSRAIKLTPDRAPDTREHFNRVVLFSLFSSRLRTRVRAPSALIIQIFGVCSCVDRRAYVPVKSLS